MTDQPVTIDENTPPEDFENVVLPDSVDVEIVKNQDPVADLDEED